MLINNDGSDGTGNLVLNGGVWENYWGYNFTNTLGTGAGEVQIPGGASGWSENGNNGMTVRINNSDAYELVWGVANEAGNANATGYFNPSPLVLQSQYAQVSSTLTLTNLIDLNGSQRGIKVAKTSVGSGYAQITNVIRNSAGTAAGLTKTGPGVLRFTNTGNSYDGPTVVNDGVLQLGSSWNNAQSIPGGISSTTGGLSNLEINGGNVRFAYYLKRGLGSGPTDIQITGGTSGFSHIQADTYGRISINNDNNYEVVWGSALLPAGRFRAER